MAAIDLTKLSDAELVKKQQAIAKARNAAYDRYEADAQAVQAELDRRGADADFDRAIASLPGDEQEWLREQRAARKKEK